ncbi:alpha/beta fold hydrolase [Mycolicibacterium flavescens]|uniref:Carboxylesterase n=1 Tax=Mycolicibacterium flavescens TaxID=1776 RepID=A0A1E3RI19_MYCFV|nr:alpha/beta hydrolase [Mycolicibacterium flavescens]MCV7282248.1 alpha/beta fold hydrolase [Mycolicibacterium flavescens]ODQ89504.1 carboxylesterase [Mycolicibacterium flavescens]
MTRHGRHPRDPAKKTAGFFVLCIAILLAACTSAPARTRHAGLDEFYEQAISWQTCDDYATTSIESAVYSAASTAECGRLLVPLNYQDPSGRTAQLAVMRVPARGESLGSLVINPGGPGGSGLFAAAAMSLGLSEERLTEHFDLVGLDPRGVGKSEPAVDCFTDAEADRGGYVLTTQGTTVQWTQQDTKAIVDRCAERSGGLDVLAGVGTRDAARDIDVLRAVLGDEKLTFLGQSYGTRLGAVYAEQFPQNVRAMLLDGAIDPHQGTAERRIAAFAGFQRAFEQMAEFCATQTVCPLGHDPDRATATFHRIVRPLYETPLPALTTDLDYDEAIGGVISGLYTEAAWPRVIAGIAQLQQGRGDELLQLNYDFALRDAEGRWTNFTEALFAINCMDEDRLSETAGNRLRADVFRVAPFMDPGVALTGARDGCEHWPAEPTLGYPYATDIADLPKTLVVSITGDPTTPHAGGVRLAETLGSALLTVEGEGHTIVTAGTNPCVNAVAADYLIDLEVPPAGTSCEL